MTREEIIETMAKQIAAVIDAIPAVDASHSRIREIRSGWVAQAALQALSDAGLVVVPREPTKEMISAGEKGCKWIEELQGARHAARGLATDAYIAMIATLPINPT